MPDPDPDPQPITAFRAVAHVAKGVGSVVNNDRFWTFVWRVSSLAVVVLVLWHLPRILGLDGSTPLKLGQVTEARGLIAAVLLITTALLVTLAVLYAMYYGTVEEVKVRVGLVKDLIAPLLGVFGTVIGFYFGSQLDGGKPAEAPPAAKAQAGTLAEPTVPKPENAARN